MQQTPLEHRFVYSFTADLSYDAGLSPLFITPVKFPFHTKEANVTFTFRTYAIVALTCKLQEVVRCSWNEVFNVRYAFLLTCKKIFYCIIIILGISFMQDIYTYIPETNHVPRERCVATILL